MDLGSFLDGELEFRKRKVADEIYINFLREGNKLNPNYIIDVGEKRGLLSRTFPIICLDVEYMTGSQVGVRFNSFMDTARRVSYKNISYEGLESLIEVALMSFSYAQEKGNITVGEIKARLRKLKKLGYPIVSGVGKMKKHEVEIYLKSVQEDLTLRLEDEKS